MAPVSPTADDPTTRAATIGDPATRRGPAMSPDAYRRITFVALLSLSVIVVTGAAVRLTGSGLGCTDWPTCQEGRLAPSEIRDAPAMVEFTNRSITGLVSIAVILAVLGSLRRQPRRRDLTWLSLGLVAGVLAQIVLGGLVVLLDLSPSLVMAHFGLSLLIVWNALVLHHRAGLPDGPSLTPPRAPSPPTRRLAVLAKLQLAMASIVVFTGTIVTAAGPHAGDEQAKRLDLALPDAARLHALTVLALIALSVFAARLARDPLVERGLRVRTSRLVLVLLAQAAVGYTQYFTHVPALLVGIHVLGALTVWIATIQLQLATASPRAEPTGPVSLTPSAAAST